MGNSERKSYVSIVACLFSDIFVLWAKIFQKWIYVNLWNACNIFLPWKRLFFWGIMYFSFWQHFLWQDTIKRSCHSLSKFALTNSHVVHVYAFKKTRKRVSQFYIIQIFASYSYYVYHILMVKHIMHQRN